MISTIPKRLRALRIYTRTRWGQIAGETGLSVRTLDKCENGIISDRSAIKLLPFLDRMEREARRWVDIDNPEEPVEYYIQEAWATGRIIEFLKKYYLVMDPPKGPFSGAEPQGGIYIQDDMQEPTFAKDDFVMLRMLKYKHLINWGYWHLVIDDALCKFIGRLYPCKPDTKIEVRPGNTEYPPIYIKREKIRAVFELTHDRLLNQNHSI